MSISLENAQKMVPFIDDPDYIKQIKEIGIPLIEDQSIKIPELVEDDNFIRILPVKKKGISPNKNPHSAYEMIRLFGALFHAIGVINTNKDLAKFKNLFDFSRLTHKKNS